MAVIRWGIAGLLIIVCVIGQYSANAWPVVILKTSASSDGQLFAMVQRQGVYGTQFIRWDRELSHRSNLFESAESDSEWHVNHDGTLIACINDSSIVVYDAQTGRRLWNKYFSRNLTTMPVSNRRSLLVVTANGTMDQIAIYDFATGELTDEMRVESGARFRDTPNVYLDPDRVTLLHAKGQSVYRVVDDQILTVDETVDKHDLGQLGAFFSFAQTRGFWKNKRIPDVTLSDGKQLRATRGSFSKPSVIWIEDISSGEVLHSDTLNLSATQRDTLNALTACLTLALMMLWRIDRLRRRPNKSRFFDLGLLIDLLVLSGLMILPYLVYHGTLVPDAIVSAQPRRLLAIAMGIATSIAFIAVQFATRPFYRWAIAFFFCIFPFLIPTILAVIVLWNTKTFRLIRQLNPNTCSVDSQQHSRDNERPKFRFGISEMLGATAAIALLMSIGRLSFEFIWQGVAIALWFLASFLLSCQVVPAAITMLICLFFVGFQNPRSDEAFLALLVASTTMTFCWLRLMNHLGSVLGKQEHEQPPELAKRQSQQPFGEGFDQQSAEQIGLIHRI